VSAAIFEILIDVPPEKPTELAGPAVGVFETTRWSVVVRAGDSHSPEAATAMERLCRTYWYPLYCFVRRNGHSHEDASDLTQAFFALFLEKRYLKSVDAALGKFRTFLLASMKHFLANEWDKSQTLKRGGGVRVLSLDDATAEDRYGLEAVEQATPETFFERRWAETVVGVVLDRLASETEEKRFQALKVFLLDDKGAVSFDEAAAQLGMTVPGVTSAIHRLRARFVALLVEEVENTVNTPEEAEAELRHLLASLAG
jgi:DNA-directed RNA polymerase specialized sigma24 family protein